MSQVDDNEMGESAEVVFSLYAMIPDEQVRVQSVLEMPNTFKMGGYFFVEVKDGVKCSDGMFYNADDGLFYDDEQFTLIGGVAVEESESTS